MNALLDFFAGGTARIQALLVAAAAMLVVILGLTTWALVERVSAVQARSERDRALDQLAVVAAAAKACTAGVDQAKRVGDAAIAATAGLVAAAARLNKPAEKTVERIETILERPAPPGAGCNQAYDELELDYQQHKEGRGP